jgi:hypothetical protein
MSADAPNSINPSDLAKVRAMVNAAASDPYFRGAVGKKLGQDQIPDDEVVDLIVGNPLLSVIYDNLLETDWGVVKVLAAAGKVYPKFPPQIDLSAICRIVWDLATCDARFDLILKQAIDDAKAPLPPVRVGGLGNIASALEGIRKAVSSGVAKHSNAVLLASIVAALLAGRVTAGVGVGFGNSGPTDAGHSDATAAALQKLAIELHDENQISIRLGEIENKIDVTQGDVAALAKSSAVVETRVNAQAVSIASVRLDLDRLNYTGNLTDRLGKIDTSISILTTDFHGLDTRLTHVETESTSLAGVAGNIARIANGISGGDPNVPALTDSLNKVAIGIGYPPLPPPATATLRTAQTTATPPPFQAVAESLRRMQGDVTSGVHAIPKPLHSELVFSSKNDVQTLDLTVGQEVCHFHVTLTDAVGNKSVTLNIAKPAGINNCGIPDPGTISIDDNRTKLPFGDVYLSLDRVAGWRFWPLIRRGYIVSVYADGPNSPTGSANIQP